MKPLKKWAALSRYVPDPKGVTPCSLRSPGRFGYPPLLRCYGFEYSLSAVGKGGLISKVATAVETTGLCASLRS